MLAIVPAQTQAASLAATLRSAEGSQALWLLVPYAQTAVGRMALNPTL